MLQVAPSKLGRATQGSLPSAKTSSKLAKIVLRDPNFQHRLGMYIHNISKSPSGRFVHFRPSLSHEDDGMFDMAVLCSSRRRLTQHEGKMRLVRARALSSQNATCERSACGQVDAMVEHEA
jgi:hypothetical protein